MKTSIANSHAARVVIPAMTFAMALLSAIAAARAPAAGPPTYDLSWHTIDGGGGPSTGGGYALHGTLGQADAGVMTGGTYVLSGGFWAGGAQPGETCPQDLTGDDDVGPADLAGVLAAWNSNPGGPPDFNANGNVGPEDLAALLASWGACP